MSYKQELTDERTKLIRRMSALMNDDGSVKSASRREFSEIKASIDRVDDKLFTLKNDAADTRGETGGRPSRERNYKHDTRVQGRNAEVLDSKMSMRTCVDRAADNGMTVETHGGRPQKIIGGDFDENAYWGQRLGLSKPGAETRALNEDTTGSGLAITPQSWTARFIEGYSDHPVEMQANYC